jgi:crossover junction endodeoxyribonuclease RuvC
MSQTHHLVLGVDPGLAATGYACVRRSGQGVEVVEKGVVRTDATLLLERRLEQLFEEMKDIFSRLHPEVVAVEALFSAYKHPQTAILMGHARGVICLCAALNGVEVVNYAVREVKQAITGSGRASKEQVQRMVVALTNLKGPVKPWDVADALAVALCHCLVRGAAAIPRPQKRTVIWTSPER